MLQKLLDFFRNIPSRDFSEYMYDLADAEDIPKAKPKSNYDHLTDYPELWD